VLVLNSLRSPEVFKIGSDGNSSMMGAGKMCPNSERLGWQCHG
jgi:hypothetical protein